ncbi:hypothetical protein EDC23_0740, partial [Thiohalophilus thiocyanatoxydans]
AWGTSLVGALSIENVLPMYLDFSVTDVS